MAGHNKWSKIKRKKAKQDKQKSKIFSKLVDQIQTEARRCGGDMNDPALQSIIDQAKDADMPKDTIERAIERGANPDESGMQAVTYETYGPGGVAIVIETQTDNRNKSAAELRHILSDAGYEMAKPGAVVWAFEQSRDDDGNRQWSPTSTIPLSDEDQEKLENLTEKLEENREVSEVFTNAE